MVVEEEETLLAWIFSRRSRKTSHAHRHATSSTASAIKMPYRIQSLLLLFELDNYHGAVTQTTTTTTTPHTTIECTITIAEISGG